MVGLALDIYNVIREHDAMPRFQEMLDKWASEHEADVKTHQEWKDRRRRHFEQLLSGNPRLLDKDAGPPGEGWQWDTSVLHTVEDPASGSQRTSTQVSGWTPPELSWGARLKINQPLPLTSDHQLTLEEKYAILAAVYDVGRKGTEQIPRWERPRSF